MKDAEHKVVTPFVSSSELKARQSKAMQTSEDIHVGPNTQLSGGFSTNGMMIVDGRVDSADIAADRLVISHIGNLEGKAVVHRAEISGVFSGELLAGDEVIVRPTARLSGTVNCQKLVIHRGARIECAFTCVSEAGAEVDSSHADSQRDKAFGQRLSALARRERLMFAAGAASVLAAMGVVAMFAGMKTLLG
jgi:cytoskeletal protein CcmA (bactofilin family)